MYMDVFLEVQSLELKNSLKWGGGGEAETNSNE